MEAMGVRGKTLSLAVTGALIGLALVACQEDLLAPADGTCPAFCPPEQLIVTDSALLDNVVSDSSFRGYVQPYEAEAMQVGRDSTPAAGPLSRGVMAFPAYADSLLLESGGSRGPVTGVDSFRLTVSVQARVADTGLVLRVHRLPAAVDSLWSFTDLAPFFEDSTLLALFPIPDSVISDTVAVALDSLAFPSFAADGNRAAIGLALESPRGYVQLGTVQSNAAAELRRYARVDSAGTEVKRLEAKVASFDTYVTSAIPPAAPDVREIGGAPSVRTMLRFDLPRRIRDSASVLRATLLLLPAQPVVGAPFDTLAVVAQGLAADVGAKSPLTLVPAEDIAALTELLPVGMSDTVRLDVTDLVRGWASDSTLPTVIAIRAVPEAVSPALLRFGGAASGARRPRLRVTFVQPLQLGGR